MEVYIEGMEMPKTCHCCRMCVQVSDGDIDWHWECCLLADEVARYATDRIPGCPLVPVPPHGDLIDRGEAIIDANERAFDFWNSNADVDSTIQFLNEQTTIIPAEEGTDFYTKGHLHLGYAEEGK